MTSTFQFFFCILLLKCQLSILHGSEAAEVKPIKGETCSTGDGATIDHENDEENPCSKEGLYNSPSSIRLTRREGIALGHVEKIQVDGEKSVELITRSLKPPIFEIPDFLSGEECDHLVKLAKRNGLEESTIAKKADTVRTRDGINASLTKELVQFYCNRIARFDSDKNGNISLNEFAGYVYRLTRMLVDLNDLWTVYKTLLPEGAHAFSYEDCMKVNRTNFVEFVYQLFNVRRLPYYNVRLSRHSWVDFNDKDPVLKQMKRRVAEVTQMSVWQIDHSEPLQVVYYHRSGHYHAHYDSTVGDDVKEKRCCKKIDDNTNSTCLLCRYITVLFYLNDVAKGGETAFPMADHEELLQAKNYITNLSRYCQKATLVLKPKKGTAVFWYNNVLDEETGKMGEVDKLSLHGGCDVKDGEKWVANLWINAPRGDENV